MRSTILACGISLLLLTTACGHDGTARRPFPCLSSGQRPPPIAPTITPSTPSLPRYAALRAAYRLTNVWHGIVGIGGSQTEVDVVAGSLRSHPMQGVVLTIDRSWEPVACQTWLGPIVTPVPGPPSGAAEIVRVVPATDTVWVRTTRDARVRAVRLTLAAIAAASVAPGLSRPSWLTGLLAQGQALGK